MTFHVAEKYRITKCGDWSSSKGDPFGMFMVPMMSGNRRTLRVIATDGLGTELEPWEHVSVSLPDRTPTWEEMARVKALFWDECDCVVQFHPPREFYVNNHPHVLHLWRPVGLSIPLPPSITVGFTEKELSEPGLLHLAMNDAERPAPAAAK